MNTVSMLVVAGLLIAVIGVGQVGADARPLAWGLAICIAVLVNWMRALQKQIDELKSASRTPMAEDHAKPRAARPVGDSCCPRHPSKCPWVLRGDVALPSANRSPKQTRGGSIHRNADHPTGIAVDLCTSAVVSNRRYT